MDFFLLKQISYFCEKIYALNVNVKYFIKSWASLKHKIVVSFCLVEKLKFLTENKIEFYTRYIPWSVFQ